ncbi:MAG TPA: D-alanine--D-alanine ligase family protein [bacterium]|nr:D-alanine--D-alanine ligase family protein [bacterium]HQI49993.1 D-alanine--D-alanine ligase family protein [bacterium]HQJ65639.1 D-alanine--D-alanine ligase family protein [bacterium]
MAKLRVGIICGGRSGEHEVSLVTAGSIIAALDKSKYEIVPIGISKQGAWLAGAEVLENLKQHRMGLAAQLSNDAGNHHLLVSKSAAGFLPAQKLDVVFPALHGPFGEDGTLQGLLELMDIPYVGAGVLGSAMAMDKIVQKHICRQQGIPTVDFLWFRDIDWRSEGGNEPFPALPDQLANRSREEIVGSLIDALGLPLFVKPPNLGSSLGISKAHDRRELFNAIEEALQYDRKVLVEKAVVQPRELEISLLGNEHPRASVAGEVFPGNEFYDYDAKYVDDNSDLQIPARLSPGQLRDLQETAIRAYVATECEGMARADFLMEKTTGRFFLSELNTIPGFTRISMYPKMWEASGLPYSALLDELIDLALQRHQRRRALRTSYQPKKEWYKG